MATKWSARFTCSSIHKWIENRPGEAEECRKRLQRLHALLAKPRRDDLCWWYKVGVEVQQILPKADRSYGSRVIRLLAKDLQPHEGQGGTGLVSRLYFARDLAAKYNLDEVRELAAKRNAAGNPLSVYHFERLLSLDDPEDRQAMLAQCVARNWSVRHLATVVQNRRGYKWRSGRFPQALQPMGLGTALRDIFLSSRLWQQHHEAWLGGKKAALERIPLKARRKKLLEELERARDGLMAVRESVSQALDRLESLARDLEKATSGGRDAETRKQRRRRPS